MLLSLKKNSRGTIFTKKRRKQNENPLYLKVQFSANGIIPDAAIRITLATFDVFGQKLLLSDNTGNIFLMDFSENKYSFITAIGQSTTAIEFSVKKSSCEFFVASLDNCFRAYSHETCELQATMRGHHLNIHSISLHPAGKVGITVGYDSAFIWDLEGFVRLRQLGSDKPNEILHVFFANHQIISCLNDDSIFVWNCDTLECEFKLASANVCPNSNSKSFFSKHQHVDLDEKAAETKRSSSSSPSQQQSPNYRTFSVSRDGRILAAAGKSKFVHLWNLQVRQLQQVIEMPYGEAPIFTRRILFLEPNQIMSSGAALMNSSQSQTHLQSRSQKLNSPMEALICVLGSDKCVRIVQLSTCRLLVQIGGVSTLQEGGRGFFSASAAAPLKINAVFTSRLHADKLALIESGQGTLDLYDLAHVWALVDQPIAPVKKVFSAANDQKSNSTKKRHASAIPSASSALSRVNLSEEYSLNDHCEYSASIWPSKPASELLSKKKLREILKEFDSFPAKYRAFLWRSIVKLPGNIMAFSALLDKGVHPSFQLLQQKYKLRSQKLSRILQKICSALGYWSPIFSECNFVPSLVFPFIQVFFNNQLFAFEMAASVLTNWCAQWFEYFPNPPINILCAVENVLAHHDRELYQHFVDIGLTTEIYAWPLMQSVFSDVLAKDQWMQLWDHVIVHPPGFLLIVVAAYAICARGPLLEVTRLDQVELFFRNQNPIVSCSQLLQRSHILNVTTPAQIHPSKLLATFTPLTKPHYPIFQRYPKFIVDHQIQERERIRIQEREFLKERCETERLQMETEKHIAEQQRLMRHQELLMIAEEKRRKMIEDEEQRMTEQQKKLYSLKHQIRVNELKLMDEANEKCTNFSNTKKELELLQLENQWRKLKNGPQTEANLAIADAQLKSLELELNKRKDEDRRNMTSISHQMLNSQRDPSKFISGLSQSTGDTPIVPPLDLETAIYSPSSLNTKN